MCKKIKVSLKKYKKNPYSIKKLIREAASSRIRTTSLKQAANEQV
ncbi:hypothetical protein RU98_GL000260 [Enterococcus caccae]|nr:hypothetical protein RU98_GL000260 [Enterococcus caccae]